MRAQVTRLEVQTLEERALAGSYFGAPTGDGGVTSPLAVLPQGTASIAVVKAAGKHYHTSTPSTADQSDQVRRPAYYLQASSLDTVDGVTGRTGGTSKGSFWSRVEPTSPTDGSSGIVSLPADPSLTLVSTDLSVGILPINGSGLGASGGGAGSGSDSTPMNPVNFVQATGSTGTTAPAGTGGIASMPLVSANPISISVSQSLIVANRLAQPGPKTDDFDPSVSDGLTIPQGHPRILFNAEPLRIEQAQAYYAEHPLNPGNDPLGNALKYVVTGDTTAAQNAITAIMNFTISDAELQGTASDNYRWNGWVPIAYDWVHDAMTPDQQQTFMDRYNYYAYTMMNKSWGGPSMVANDYFWGYFANELNWAVATYYENPMAQTFLDDALITRWQNSFLPWAAGPGRGGVEPEGTQYGRYDLAYPAMPLATAGLMGGDQYASTNFYKEAIFNLIYTTSPAPTYSKESPTDPYYMPFPFGENEINGGYPSATETYYGDFMQTWATAYNNLPVGQYAYHWLQTVRPQQTYWYTYPTYLDTPTYDPTVQTPDFSSLPVDYYAPGAQDFYTRNQWGPQATSVFLQLGSPSPNVLDSGSFQIWRNGWFVSKETSGYDLQINGGQSEDPIAHNTILFGGQGIARAYRYGDPQVIRLQSDPVFSYAAVDMSNAFQSSSSNYTNPYAAHAIREFLFIKPLETMVVLDRMESSDAAEPAADVTKTFLLHFPNQPQVTGANSVIGYSGDQALRLTTLVPSNPTFNVVDESNFSGSHDTDPAYYQYRLEETTSGSAQSYFLNVLQARDATGSNVASHMTQNATSWTITLDSPTLGHAQIVLNKGMDSQGGAVGFSATGTPTEFTPLLDHVQDMQVTDYGPVWGN